MTKTRHSSIIKTYGKSTGLLLLSLQTKRICRSSAGILSGQARPLQHWS